MVARERKLKQARLFKPLPERKARKLSRNAAPLLSIYVPKYFSNSLLSKSPTRIVPLQLLFSEDFNRRSTHRVTLGNVSEKLAYSVLAQIEKSLLELPKEDIELNLVALRQALRSASLPHDYELQGLEKISLNHWSYESFMNKENFILVARAAQQLSRGVVFSYLNERGVVNSQGGNIRSLNSDRFTCVDEEGKIKSFLWKGVQSGAMLESSVGSSPRSNWVIDFSLLPTQDKKLTGRLELKDLSVPGASEESFDKTSDNCCHACGQSLPLDD